MIKAVRRLAGALWKGRAISTNPSQSHDSLDSREQGLAHLDLGADKQSGEVIRLLNEAFVSRESDDVDHALGLMGEVGFRPSFLPMLIKLLDASWHKSHEALIVLFQEVKEPDTVDALYRAALVTHAYREYDDYGALIRRCTWALADIGTPEARNRLELLAASADELIAAFAQRRLDRWENELHRKGKVL
jgi:hypothetical protein